MGSQAQAGKRKPRIRSRTGPPANQQRHCGSATCCATPGKEITCPHLQPFFCSQPITGDDADELVAEFRDSDRGSLFRLEGAGPQRSVVVTSARGNEHQLEKVMVTCFDSGLTRSHPA